MVYKSNFLALVFEKDKKQVVIWDDYEERACTEISFHSEIISMKIWKDKFVVVLLDKIYIFNFSTMECIDQVETYENPEGICGMAANEHLTIIVIPHKEVGMIKTQIFEDEQT